MLFSLKNLAKVIFCGELLVVIIGDTFSLILETLIELEGSTILLHINPIISTIEEIIHI